jgi:hypothetical protein
MPEVGRPTEYSPKLLAKANEYLDLCKDEEIQTVRLVNEEKGYTSYENKLKVKLPSIEGLARYLGVARSTVYEWEKIHSEFSDILEQVKQEQAERLINNGLSGDYNSTISKLILTKHGYSDKSETDITTKGEQLPGIINIIKPSEVTSDADIQSESEAVPSVGASDEPTND